MSRAITKAQRIAAAKRIMDSAAARSIVPYWEKGGKQYISDGYRVVVLNSPLPLPEVDPEDKDRSTEIMKGFDEISDKAITKCCAPSVDLLKKYITEAKGEKRCSGKFRWSGEFPIYQDKDFPYCDAGLLLDILILLSNTTQGFEVKSRFFEVEHAKGPAEHSYLESPLGKAVLLGIAHKY